jgi:two-component system, cell cycle response regulator
MKLVDTSFLTKPPLTVKQVVIRILLIEMTIEFSIMLLFSVFPHKFGTFSGAFIDATMLVILTTPFIYFWVIKPFAEARQEAVVHINHLAHSDSLTKLANYQLVIENLELMVASHARNADQGAILIVDLDNFKLVNDKYGPDVGDALLIKIGERLKNIVRGGDLVGRLGADKFIVLLRKLGAEDIAARYVAQLVAYKLIKEVMEPVEHNSNKLLVGASVGIRLFDTETDVHKIIGDADVALHRAKENGKGCVMFFDK